MGRIVVVAEKPSVAREIARVLGCRKKAEGFLFSEQYAVTWALGHLITQCQPDQLDERYTRWRSEDLPILPQEIPLQIVRGRKQQFTIVKKLICAKDTDSLICATDAGREGELIFRWIYAFAGCRKPVQRLWISSMTDEAIEKGLHDLRPASAYEGLYQSARSRAWADWVVGMNATRAYTVRYGTLLSIGRVQTPTLAFLVQRQKQIDAFVPENYYLVTADFGDYKAQWRDEKTGKSQISSEEMADQIKRRVRGKTGRIAQVQREQKTQNPPLLYDLTELQRDCNRAFGFTAKKTLEIAQSLYEKRKLITYPRTDSRYLTADVARKLPQTLARVQVPTLNAVLEAVRTQAPPTSTRIVNESRVSDHHAILPTGARVAFETLSEQEQKVYEHIVRRVVAALMPPWKYEDTTIVTVVHTQQADDAFVCRGRVSHSEGWKALYPAAKGDKDAGGLLPDVSVGQERNVVRISSKKKQTTPPAQYTEATLLSAMEHAGRQIEDEQLREQMKDCGLGTPATRAAIIERILQTGYAKRSGKTLVATQKGIQLIEILPQQMTSAQLTGKWEAALAHMASETADEQAQNRFTDSIEAFVRFIVQQAAQKTEGVTFEKESYPASRRTKAKRAPQSIGRCPICGEGQVLENSKAFYCSRWQEGCKLTWWKNAVQKQGGPLLTPRIAALLLENKRVQGSTGVLSFDARGVLGFTPQQGNELKTGEENKNA
jgi:DNA topoisomerase-3